MKKKQTFITTEILNKWLKNPYWRGYYEQAPTENCREMIALEFMYSENDSEEIAAALDEKERTLTLKDWQHLYKYCGNNPRKKLIQNRIREMGGEVKPG